MAGRPQAIGYYLKGWAIGYYLKGSGPDGRLAARRRLRPADFHRRPPGLGGPRLLSAQARAIVSWKPF